MIVWTMQPQTILEQIQETGVYICDPDRIHMQEFTDVYSWRYHGSASADLAVICMDVRSKSVGNSPFPGWKQIAAGLLTISTNYC